MRYSLQPAKRTKSFQLGFTIVELLIAMLIFSLVLILITVGVLTFTKTYFKGLNQSKAQNAARTIIESVSQSIQFSGGAVNPDYAALPADGSDGFCVGDKRYSFRQGKQLVGDSPSSSQTKHALKVDEPGNCGGAGPQIMTANPEGLELLTPGMRISNLKVEPLGTSSNYRIIVRVTYGEDSLLYSPSGNLKGAEAEDATCQIGISGSHFCASAELSTIVNKRLNQTP